MGTKFTYALIMTVVGAIFRLLLFFTGFETEKLHIGQYLNWIMLPVVFAILYFGLKAVRDERPHQAITYGGAVGAGTLICLMSSAMSAVFTFIHLKFINTSFADYQIALLRDAWAQAGLNDNAMTQAEAVTRMMMSPAISAGMALIVGTVFGVIMVLIVAAFVKRPLPAGAEPPL